MDETLTEMSDRPTTRNNKNNDENEKRETEIWKTDQHSEQRRNADDRKKKIPSKQLTEQDSSEDKNRKRKSITKTPQIIYNP